MVLYPGAQVLDVAGPVEVFDTAGRLLGGSAPAYRVECVSVGAPWVRTSAGVKVGAEVLAADDEPIDTLVVPGGWGLKAALEDPALITLIKDAAARSRRVTSVCGGAFLLAEAGLLDGRRATTHWAYCEEMTQRYPQVRVDRRPIFVWDGRFVTSAGVSTGIDMALALVEADHGEPVALEVARFLVLFFKRHGGQPQLSALLDAQLAERPPIRAVQEWIVANLDRPMPVADLAMRATMSTRNFARVFRREVGLTPGRYVVRMRVARGRELLESTSLPVNQVARRCGFPAVETFLRAFGRVVGMTPGEYRHRFQAGALPSGLFADTLDTSLVAADAA